MNAPLGSPFSRQSDNSQRLPAFGLITFAICFILGMLTVAWHVWSKGKAERARAQTELQSRAAALELQFSRPIKAAEALGSSFRQAGGGFPNFAQVAGVLYAACPELASLELQPGGVVSEVVPHSANQRAPGFNVLKDPAYRAGANAAVQSGRCTVLMPVPLARGNLGLVAMVPVFQNGHPGENRFWGFVAASIGLAEALRPVGLEQLRQLGYDHALFIPGSASRQAIALSRSGLERLDDAITQPIRLQNLELRLAVRRQGGWISKPRLLLESLGVCFGSLLVSGLISSLSWHQKSQRALAQANQLLGQETSRLERIQDEVATLKSDAELELKKTKAELTTAQAEMAKQKQDLQEFSESRQSLETAFHKARAGADELQARFERSVKSHEQELKATQEELTEAKARLESATEKIASLEASLAKAMQTGEAARSKLQLQEKKSQSVLADLQSRLEAEKEAATRSSAEQAVKLREAEASIRELKGKLASAGQPKDKGMDPEVAAPVAEAPEATVLAPSGGQAPPEPPKRKRTRRRDHNQIDLFGADNAEASEGDSEDGDEEKGQVVAGFGSEDPVDPETGEPALGEDETGERKSPPRRSVDIGELRRAVHEIVPLLADKDPGARDCLKANRAIFRSAFLPAGFEDFEQLVRGGTFAEALDRLTRLARRHGIQI